MHTPEKYWPGYEQLLLIPLLIGGWVTGFILLTSIPAPLFFLVETITSEHSSLYWISQIIIDSTGSGIVSYLFVKYLLLNHFSKTATLLGCASISPIIWWFMQLFQLHDGAVFPMNILYLSFLVVSATAGAYISVLRKKGEAEKSEYMQVGCCRPSSLQRRFGAVIVDVVSIIMLFILIGIMVSSLVTEIYGAETVAQVLQNPANQGGAVFTVFFFMYMWFLSIIIYFFIPTVKAGKTLGKKLFGIKVISADGKPLKYQQVFVGLAMSVPSLLFLGLGFLPALKDPQKRALHDKASGTMVVKA